MAEPVEEVDVGGPDLAASGSDGLAAALIAALGRRGDLPRTDPKLDAFLDEQRDLVRIQKEHLHEQRQVILARLRLGRIADRLKILLQAMTALTGLAVVLALAVMAWQAHEDRGVVIEAFSVPPDFAQRGMTGQVVAGRLLGRIADLQAKTITALAKASEAIKLDPLIDPAYPIQGTADDELGRPEDNLAMIRVELRMLESGRVEGISPQAARVKRDWIRGGIAADFGDYTPQAAALQRMPEVENYEGAGGYSFRDDLADDLLNLHDVSGARSQYPTRSPPNWGLRESVAEALDAWSTALGLTDQQPTSVRLAPETQADRAYLLAHLGRIAEAQAAIAPTSSDCTDCLEARGVIAAYAGDRQGVDQWFKETVRQAPLPTYYLPWGQSLLMLGEPDAAIVELKQAHKLGPHYADPLEVWGEALIAKRDYAGAISKFAEADKDAPKWGRNHLRWGAALMLSGRYAEARAQYQLASGLDLSIGDRAALNVLLARTEAGPLHG